VSTLDHLRKAAKRWLRSLREGDAAARARLERAWPGAPAHPTLRDVQHALAREGGHPSWIALTRAVDLDVKDAVGLSALDKAALDGDEETVRRLIAAGARITAPAAIVLDRADDLERLVREDPELLSTTNNRPWARLLVHASGRARGAVVEKLLRVVMRHRSGLSIVNMDDDRETAAEGASGYTPLHAAAFHGNDEAVEVLLRHGANPRARDGKRCATPAGWAASAGHAATAGRILEADVDIFDAIAFDRADRVGDILDRDPGAIDRPFRAYASCPPGEGRGWPPPDATPLQWAAAQGKPAAVRVLTERGAAARSADDLQRARRVLEFLQSACWDHEVHGKGEHRLHDRAAQRLLAQDPSLARDSLYTAIVCGDRVEVERILSARPEAAAARGGPRGWSPILYLGYTRFTHGPTLANALAIARLLLDRGADPDDFYMAGDSRYSVLTGVAGEGEQDAPRQPYAPELFDLLLARGAEPFDIQVLYDTHFSGDMLWWLERVYTHTAEGPRGGAWKDPEWTMLDMGAYGSGARFVLETAIKTRNLALAEWGLAHGANPDAAPPRDKRFPKVSLHELAVREALGEIADLLARHGASRARPSLDEREAFLDACFRLERDQARRLLAAHPEYRRSPAAMAAAARRDRADVLGLLLDLGFSIEVADPTGKRPLHEAAAHGALRAVAFLVERGAEVDPRESSYNGTPLGWAAHGDKMAVADFLSRHSRDIWTLCFRGYVERVREVLAEDPRRALVIGRQGQTPLWWLPDDEAKAMTTVELLLAAGVDPAARNQEGHTAADWARRRGMLEAAARLDQAMRPTKS
jgi:ankyrin repeat protein